MAEHERASDHLLQLARLLQDLLSENNFSEINGMFQRKVKNPPAAKSFLANLPTQRKDEDRCPVCLIGFDYESLVKELPKCRHCFHADCIIPWLEKTNTCPVCRHEYPTDDLEYEEERRLKEKESDKEERLEDLHNSMFS
ncbi:E3 ubiquitin-protein ligase RNF181-like [Clytia hemisphaerica]|uniref:E3 ubiquitin-protein ligase RNF181-like n=1 Tax=Clytia hemisphaerica TaxID=252671 RepID=UPI0034D6CB6D